jgi:anti-sigma factor RsiW
VICRELVDFLTDYVEGALSPAERKSFEDHFEKCPDCAAYVATYQTAIRLARAALRDGQEPVLPTLPEELVQAIQTSRRRPKS